MHGEDSDDLVRGVGAQRGLDHRGVDRLALDPGRADHVGAEGFGLHRPALGEMPGAGDQHLAAGRDEVGDHRLPRAVAIGRVHEHVAARVQQALQAGLAGRDAAVDARVGQVHRLAAHRVQHLVGHAARAGGVQEAVAGDAGGGVHGVDANSPRFEASAV